MKQLKFRKIKEFLKRTCLPFLYTGMDDNRATFFLFSKDTNSIMGAILS